MRNPAPGSQTRRERRRKRKNRLRMNGVEAKEDMNDISNKERDDGRTKCGTSAKTSLKAIAEKDLETVSLIAKIVISDGNEEIVRASDQAVSLKGDSVNIPIVKEEGCSTKGANSDSSNTVMLPGINSNSDIIGNNVSKRRRRRKRKKKVLDFSEYNVGLNKDCRSFISSSLLGTMEKELGGKNHGGASAENESVMSTAIEDNGLRKSLDEYPPNGSSICPQMFMNSCHMQYPLQRQENGKGSKCLMCNAERFHEDVPSSQLQVVECGNVNYAEKSGLALGSIGHAADDISFPDEAVLVPIGRGLVGSIKKKLLVLDLNGLLADIRDVREAHTPHQRIGRKTVFKRPFCDDFLRFCFERFAVGVWSSRKKSNVEKVVDYLMADFKEKLLFCWDQSKCTSTKSKTLEDRHKPLVLKELKKLWNKDEPTLPWKIGEYSPSNTLLVDDSPYKALCNPPHTAIFPLPYNFTNEDDNSLGPGGDLCNYLEGVAIAHDVQHYVQHHPFGQPAITERSPFWYFYLRVMNTLEKSSAPV